MTPNKLFYSVSEVAQELGCARSQVIRLLKDGVLRCVYVGHLLRIPASALHELAA